MKREQPFSFVVEFATNTHAAIRFHPGSDYEESITAHWGDVTHELAKRFRSYVESTIEPGDAKAGTRFEFVASGVLEQSPPLPLSCNGWNYHVFPLGAENCCLCGKTREEIQA